MTALALAPPFACPDCGVPSPAAASFCGWCRRPFVADFGLPTLALDEEGRHAVEPMPALSDCGEPWAWGSDGRSLYLFEGVERGAKLAVRRVPVRGEAASPPVTLLAADAVRGLAVTRRGAFAAARGAVCGLASSKTLEGEARPVEFRLPGAEIIGFAGAGDRLFLACIEGGRLTVRAGSTAGSPPPILASCAWPGGAASWLHLYVDADLRTALLWGAGLVGTADLTLGVLTLAPHPEAPLAEPLEILKRRGDARVAAQPMRPTAYPGVAAVPLEGGGWGLLDFVTATVAKPPADCGDPLAVVAVEGGAVALRPGFLAHLELAGGALRERRIPIGPSDAAALSAGPEVAVALISRPDKSLVMADAHLALGRPPSAKAETELARAGSGADAFSMLPPQAVGGRLWFAALAGDQLLLWASRPEGAA